MTLLRQGLYFALNLKPIFSFAGRKVFLIGIFVASLVFVLWVSHGKVWQVGSPRWRRFDKINSDSYEGQPYRVDNAYKEVPTETFGWNQPIPQELRKFIPLNFPNNSEYLVVPHADLIGFGDYDSFKTIQDLTYALKKCDEMKDFCKALSVNPRYKMTLAYVKKELGIPQVSSQSLYIKKMYLEYYLKVLSINLKCVYQNHTANLDKNCKLPDLDPWAKDIVHLVHTLPPRKCNEEELYTELRNNILSLRDERRNDSDFVCAQAESIIRGNRDFQSTFGPPRNLTLDNPSFHIDGDFWKVTTILKNNKKFETFHLSIVEKPDVIQRMLPEDAPLDVYILTFDSTSEAHFRRMLPKSHAFIKNELGAFMFKGYSVVGDSTLPNVNAMLTGIPIEENRKIPNLNDWPLIYKDLKNIGFATMLSEDMSMYGTFTLTLPGFNDPPTDHYAQPLWSSGALGQCLGGQFQLKLQLDYLKSFMKSYKERRKFGHIHLCDLCHRELNLLSTADQELLGFFKSLKDENLLNQSMFIINGDHGPRQGHIRELTFQGKLEERLPMLAVTLPPWFQKKYFKSVENFQRSTQIITSPYDLHSTFLHLMEFSKPFNNHTGIGTSLFEKLSEDRKCADAGITDQWCPCVEWHQIDHTHEQIKISAVRIVLWMNQNLADNPLSKALCSKIRLKRIINAVQQVPKHSKFSVYVKRCKYQIQLETVPGNALFEVTIDLLNADKYTIFDVSRINAYGSQAECIESRVPSVRKYCYCI